MVGSRVVARAVGAFAVVCEGFVDLRRSSMEVVYVENLWLRRRGLAVAGVVTTIELQGA